MTAVEDLRQAISRKKAVLVVGAGITKAISKPSGCATWSELLNFAVNYFEDEPEYNEMSASTVKLMVDAAKKDPRYVLNACDTISSTLGGKESGRYRTFFRDAFDRMEANDTSQTLIDAIRAIDAPIFTTNYDTVLDSSLGRSSATWLDEFKAGKIIRRESRDVFHLHGKWDEPTSIIFDSVDYNTITNSDAAKSIRDSIGMLESIVFIGCGEGLNDPHFSALWDYLAPLRALHGQHYLLALTDDVSNFKELHDKDVVRPVPYGNSHSDLGVFLKGLVTSTAVSDQSAEDKNADRKAQSDSGIELQIDAIRSQSLLKGVNSDDEAEYGLDDLIVEPLLLPVPPEQFSSEAFSDGGKALKPYEAEDIVAGKFNIVIVGDEQSGLTTALRWAICKRAARTDEIPVYIDLLAQRGPFNLDKLVRRELRLAGVEIGNRQPLPDVALAIDNVTGLNEQSLARVVATVDKMKVRKLFIGCQVGSELQLSDQLMRRFDDVRTTFLGRLGLQRTVELARRVSPTDAKKVASKALHIAQKEGIPRTPLSITFLIIGICSDDAWVNTVSNTNFLDSFVDSLLGRGDLFDDMRIQIDSSGYSLVLQCLSQEIIKNNVADLSAADFTSFLHDLFDRLDWSDKPEAVAENLIRKGLLVQRGGGYRFRQGAYLHIFAARAARHDREFLTKLKDQPLYYSAILRHYAALARDDEELLEWAVSFAPEMGGDASVDGAYSGESSRYDSFHRGVASQLGHVALETSDEEVAETSVEAGRLDEDDDDILSEHDPYLVAPDAEQEPFPSIDYERAPEIVVLSARLKLVSNILRDSELVANPSLKEKALVQVLELWGMRSELYFQSSELTDLVQLIFDTVHDLFGFTEQAGTEFKDTLKSTWPVFDLMHGMGDELATIKLSRALSRVFDGNPTEQGANVMLPAAVLSVVGRDDNWTDQVGNVLRSFPSTEFAKGLAGWLFSAIYILSSGRPSDVDRVEDILIEYYRLQTERSSPGTETYTRDQWRQALKRSKAQVHWRLTSLSYNGEQRAVGESPE